MATSGSWDYSLTALNIIDTALENLRILSAGGTATANQTSMLLRRLNMIAKQWQGTADGSPGLKIHTRQRVTLMLAVGQQSYLIGPASTDARASTAIGRTTISATEAAGQTVLSITATTDTTMYPGTTITMTASDFIGIQLDDGTLQWTTISSTGAGPTVTVGAALTSQASSGNYVYWFTSRAQRFPVIESAVMRDVNRNTWPLGIYVEAAQYDQGVADKYAPGTPTSILVEPLRIATRVTLDSQPTDVKQQIVLTVLYPSEDYDSSSDDIAYPQEWLMALSWQLAFVCAPALGVQWTADMELNRQESKRIAMSINPETSALYFQSAT